MGAIRARGRRSGGGVANPEFVQRLADGDASADADTSPRTIMRAFYWSPDFTIDPVWEDELTEEILKAEGIHSSETLIAFRTYSRYDLEHMFSVGMD